MNYSAENLRACLLAGPTASAVLGDWCARRFGPGSLTAWKLEDREIPNGRRHRRVELRWRDIAVSCAENVYVPAGLPECVRHQVRDTSIPFGILLETSGLVRRTTLARQLTADGPFVLEIRATLALPSHGHVASVHEFYHRALID